MTAHISCSVVVHLTSASVSFFFFFLERDGASVLCEDGPNACDGGIGDEFDIAQIFEGHERQTGCCEQCLLDGVSKALLIVSDVP